VKVAGDNVIMGVELEGYTISVPDYHISRKMAFYRKGAAEKGERFSRDWTIGSEYNSRPFTTIREGFFLLKTGLRKYNLDHYTQRRVAKRGRQFFLVGGWRDRFAGTHIHISFKRKRMTLARAQRVCSHLHDHLPLLIAVCANSPVWADKITERSSARVLRGSRKYFLPIRRDGLEVNEFNEMTFSRGRKRKPPTLEIRIMDSNIPEFVMVAASIIRACALAALSRERPANKISHFSYLRSRQEAAMHGMKARLCWNGRWLSATDYLDRFVWVYRKQFQRMDIPYEIWQVMKLLKRGLNGSEILRQASVHSYKHHPQTWQRRFAKRYVSAVAPLLNGNNFRDYLLTLQVKSPRLQNVWLGRRKLRLL
jgi:hypothetical protein